MLKKNGTKILHWLHNFLHLHYLYSGPGIFKYILRKMFICNALVILFYATSGLTFRLLKTSMVLVPWLMQRYYFLGGFRVTGKVCTQCSLSDPISGELTVEASAVPIDSIDIHLFRVESILHGEKIASETSLIQTTQASNHGYVLKCFELH